MKEQFQERADGRRIRSGNKQARVPRRHGRVHSRTPRKRDQTGPGCPLLNPPVRRLSVSVARYGLAPLGWGYPVADGIVNQLHQGMEAELKHDLGPVRLDSPDRDPQERGDLLIRFPLSQEADDLRLARSYTRIYPLPSLMLAFFLEKTFQHDFRYF